MIFLKKWKNKNKFKLIISITFIFICFVVLYSQFLFRSTFFQDIGGLVTKLFVVKNVNYINTTSLQEENLKNEISELKKLLALKETMAGYEMIYTTIINRNSDYWFYTITVDKGKKDGVEIDMVVINQDGLVGRVVEVYNYSSVIKLISANDSLNKVAVDIVSNDNTYKGIVSGYDISSDKILITSVRSSSDIKIGDKVMTNGIGNLFPSGVVIGTVDEVTSDDLGVSKVLKVDSLVDFENLRYLAILKRGSGD